MSTPPLLTGLPPIASGNPRLLILGNMPSAMSLTTGQYYGNPRNAFWRIMEDLFECDRTSAYQERLATLTSKGIAVWDVLHQCRRTGSLDSAVERDSMVANDFADFYAKHNTLERVFFNGAAAEQNYRRLVRPSPSLTYMRLPSTSPAHTMRYPDKLDAWRSLEVS